MSMFPERAALQSERTALAWQRTAITATVIMLPLLLVNARNDAWLMTVLGSVATIAAGVLVAGVHHRFAQLQDDAQPFSPRDPMVRVAAVTTLSAVIGAGTATALFLR